MERSEQKVSKQLDVVHFIQNSFIIEALLKLNLTKTERYLLRRQPKVHLLNQSCQSSSSDSDIKENKLQYLNENSNSEGKILDLYFGKGKGNEKSVGQALSQSIDRTKEDIQL